MMSTKPRVFNGEGSAIDDYNKPKVQLQKIVNGDNNKNWGLFDKTNQQHKTLLSQLRTLQWTAPNGKWGEVADISRLSEFLKSDKSPIKKPLKNMNSKEVSKIIECFKSMIIKTYK
ncbi:hypothetical protein SGQ83_01280 [Flavobacterium sp. Fl-318]|uniref:Uncharacterized protein n=1 Tax=Flavobacterium cupriresistens TaxID=2893885 RepID=A0ABU4R5V7_9FLAO|nr:MULTISPECIES: hypothetical protein [unclassified Flavobacterium]MDX6187967.1 hypothetical protein [Flavobacterium sp. Fl-318]UFH42113.1 hypothetical protein LNP23_20170 [Flavobacterium sp. F-323]